MMEAFAAYGHAIFSLAIWSLLVSVLAAVSTSGRTPENRCDCGKPKRDYTNPVYRSERAFANAVETSGPFVASTVAAILAGADPFWVNLLASVFILARVATALVHIRTENQAARSATWGIALLCVILMALFAVGAVIWG
tara:strand:- start:2213 stop:2629 length:417 start_codon:yes stop_codon:yes gene_type:complete